MPQCHHIIYNWMTLHAFHTLLLTHGKDTVMVHDAVLMTLDKKRGELITGGELSRTLNVSRNTVWKSISKLRADGHNIISHPNKGYSLDVASDGLSKVLIESQLNTMSIGRELLVLKTVDSTNNYLKTLPSKSAKHGMTVVANEQTGGRGRFDGREFSSLHNEGIYLSIILKPQLPIQTLQLLTFCAAVSVAKAIEEVCSLQPEIKWVNDILLRGKKVCGILSEVSLSAELQLVDYAVVGIGINTGDLPLALTDIATSISRESGKTGMRNTLIAATLNHFEEAYLMLERGEDKQLLKEYEAHLCLIGRQVKVSSCGECLDMTVKGIDQNGALVGVDTHGAEHHISAGEVTSFNRL